MGALKTEYLSLHSIKNISFILHCIKLLFNVFSSKVCQHINYFTLYIAIVQCFQFEGVPTYPDPGRFWAIVEKYKVTKFYTAPTAIRSLMGFGDEHVTK